MSNKIAKISGADNLNNALNESLKPFEEQLKEETAKAKAFLDMFKGGKPEK